MKGLGITNGEWKSIFRNKHDRGIRSDKGYICFMAMPIHYPQQDARYDEELNECRADANLIADAGNTAQKCGLLPSELLQQRDELKEALTNMVWQFARRNTYEEQESLYTGGLSALEYAFDTLGIWDPIAIADFVAAIKKTERL